MRHASTLTLCGSATASGMYTLAVLYDSEHVEKSPMRFVVTPADPWIPAFTSIFPYTLDCNPSSGCSQLQFIATAGKEASFQVQSRDFWGNRRSDPEVVKLLLVAFHVVNTSERLSFNGTVSALDSGIFKASFMTTESGKYRVYVYSRASSSQYISGSPFIYSIRPAAISAANCFISNLRDFEAEAGVPLTFSIQVLCQMDHSAAYFRAN
jgi:hypothetical protein